MSHRLLAVLIGGLLLLPAAAAVAAPSNVTLRVEGADRTLVPRTALKTDARVVNKDGVAGHDCTGTSAAGALEIGTGGDWGGTWFSGLQYSVERIRGETHNFNPTFYELRINNRTQQVGICGAELQEGDDVLLFVSQCDGFGPPPDFACLNPVLPLGLSAPSTVAPGAPFNVSVVEYAGDGSPAPVAGATIDGGDGPVTTNAAGVAVVTAASAGPRSLVASKPGRARSAAQAICATTGADGACGTTPTVGAVAICETNGSDGRCGTRDRTVPLTRIEGIADGQRFARGKAPRTLRVKVTPDASGLLTVKLRLTRTVGPRCSYFSGKLERLRRAARCGAAGGFWFAIGDRENASYLLPGDLPRGRYVLDVNAIDKAYNRDDARRRGSNRIVFHVA
jgi:hypothetical protein